MEQKRDDRWEGGMKNVKGENKQLEGKMDGQDKVDRVKTN